MTVWRVVLESGLIEPSRKCTSLDTMLVVWIVSAMLVWLKVFQILLVKTGVLNQSNTKYLALIGATDVSGFFGAPPYNRSLLKLEYSDDRACETP
jgi:hypothetical protein